MSNETVTIYPVTSTECRWTRRDEHATPTSEFHEDDTERAGAFIPDQSLYLLDQGGGGQFVHRGTGGPQRQTIGGTLRAFALCRCGGFFERGRSPPNRASHAVTISDSHVYLQVLATLEKCDASTMPLTSQRTARRASCAP